MLDLTKPLQTRGGRDVRILSTDAMPPYSVVYETISGPPVLQRVTPEGVLVTKFTPSQFDLINKPEVLGEETFYVNVGDSFSSKKPANARYQGGWPVLRVVAKVGPDGLEDIRELVSTEVVSG